MSFLTHEEAVDKSLDQRMEVVYATINRELVKKDQVRYRNNPEIQDARTAVKIQESNDQDLKDRIIKELEAAGWERPTVKWVGENVLEVVFYKAKAATPEPEPEEPGTDEPETPEQPEDPQTPPDEPEELPDYLTDVSHSEGGVSTKALKEDGTLLVGSGNPNGDFSVASNGELELALAARLYRKSKTIAPADGVYQLSVADDGDWNWPYSIALLEEDRPVTDLYDVTLSVLAKTTGNVLEFALSRSEDGVYHFKNEEHELDINDNAKTESGSVVQNIQRTKFYEAQLGEMEKNTAGALLGEFTLSLKAVRLEGEVAPVELSIEVNAVKA